MHPMTTPLFLDHYATPGIMTDAGELAPLLDALPRDLGALVEALQGLMVHIFWAERYGLSLSDERKAEVNLRRVDKQLRRLIELDDAPLAQARPLERKLVGNCRDFATVLAAFLRHQGTPARARCGFGTYFVPDHYEDHWVCEVWRADEGRWALVDAQLDALQREAMAIPFDPLDVPRDQFVVAGDAWQLCRNGAANPDDFGIFQWHGWAFVRGNVVRDVLALCRVEILPWDEWGQIIPDDDRAVTESVDLVDEMARLSSQAGVTQDQASALAAVRAFYEAHLAGCPGEGVLD